MLETTLVWNLPTPLSFRGDRIMISGYTDTLGATFVVAAHLLSGQVDIDPSKLNIQEAFCLAQNIWFESRSESREDKVAVAQTTLNRVLLPAYPNTICEVVYECRTSRVCQFSWVNDGKPNNPRLDTPVRRSAWSQTVEVTLLTLFGIEEDISGGASHYHAHYVSPSWASAMIETAKTDGHVFYRQESEDPRIITVAGVFPKLKPEIHTVEEHVEQPSVLMALLGWIFDKVIG
jgi:hypothetical protein